MKVITPEVVMHVQTFLKDVGIFYGVPAEEWSAQALKALHEYRRRQGVRPPHHTMMPNSVEGLPEELQKYIADKEAADLIEVSGGEEEPVALETDGVLHINQNLIISTGTVLGETQLAVLSRAEHTTLTSDLSVGLPQDSIVGGNNGDIEIVVTPKADQEDSAPAEIKLEENAQEAPTTEVKKEEAPASTPVTPKVVLPPLKKKKKK